MKPDRPLILSILFLAGGLWLIFGYAQGTAGLSAAMPIANSTLHINVNTTGPTALGGIALLGIGVVLLVWSMLAAIVSQLMLLGGGHDAPRGLLESRSSEIDEDDEPVSRAGSRNRGFSMLGLQSAEPADPTARARMREEEIEPPRPSSLPAGIRP